MVRNIYRKIKRFFKDNKYKKGFKRRIDNAPYKNDLEENLYLFRYLCHQIEKTIKNEFVVNKVRGEAKYNKAKEIVAVLDYSEWNDSEDYIWGKDILHKYELWRDGKYKHEIGSTVFQQPKTQSFEDVIYSRRSIRYWSNKEVNHEIIYKIIDLGIMAPTSCNRQAFRITVAQNMDKNIDEGGNTTNKSMISKAPYVFYVSIDRRLYPEIHAPAIDAGIIGQNLMLGLQYYNLGGCPMYHGESYNQKYLRNQLKLDKYQFIYIAIPFGYPAEKPDTPTRVGRSRVSSIVSLDLNKVSKNI